MAYWRAERKGGKGGREKKKREKWMGKGKKVDGRKEGMKKRKEKGSEEDRL